MVEDCAVLLLDERRAFNSCAAPLRRRILKGEVHFESLGLLHMAVQFTLNTGFQTAVKLLTPAYGVSRSRA